MTIINDTKQGWVALMSTMFPYVLAGSFLMFISISVVISILCSHVFLGYPEDITVVLILPMIFFYSILSILGYFLLSIIVFWVLDMLIYKPKLRSIIAHLSILLSLLVIGSGFVWYLYSTIAEYLFWFIVSLFLFMELVIFILLVPLQQLHLDKKQIFHACGAKIWVSILVLMLSVLVFSLFIGMDSEYYFIPTSALALAFLLPFMINSLFLIKEIIRQNKIKKYIA